MNDHEKRQRARKEEEAESLLLRCPEAVDLCTKHSASIRRLYKVGGGCWAGMFHLKRLNHLREELSKLLKKEDVDLLFEVYI